MRSVTPGKFSSKKGSRFEDVASREEKAAAGMKRVHVNEPSREGMAMNI